MTKDNSKKIKVKSKIMYITEIVQYLIWPAFIIVSWFIIEAGVNYYEKKFPVKE